MNQGLWINKDKDIPLAQAFAEFARSSEGLMQYFSRLQEQVKELTEELQRSRRLAAIGQVSASLAHEIRNPLAGMSLSLSVLRRSCDGGNSTVQEAISKIEEGINRINRIITDVLQFAQDITVNPKEVRIDQMIKSFLSVLEYKLQEKNISIEFVNELEDNSKVFLDPHLMERIFLNVLENAIEFSPVGGVLWISLWKTDGYLWITVEDSGQGFSEEAILRGTEPFFTTRPDGTGLGLSIVERCIEAHKGKLEILNTQRGGMVRICLPY